MTTRPVCVWCVGVYSSGGGTFRPVWRHQVQTQHHRRIGRWRHFRPTRCLRAPVTPATAVGVISTATPRRGTVSTGTSARARRHVAQRSVPVETQNGLQRRQQRTMARLWGEIRTRCRDWPNSTAGANTVLSKKPYVLNVKPISERQGVACHMGSHNATCHPT